MRMSKKNWFAGMAIFALALVGVVAGCNRSAGEKKRQVAFVTNNAADFWTIARKGCEKAQRDIPGVDVEFRINSDGTAAEQKRILEDLLAKGTQAFAVSPIDPANQTTLLNDLAKQAVVMTQDSDAPQSNRMCYLGTDNHAAGMQAGELLKEALPNGGDVMVFVGKLDAQNAQERLRGVRDAIAGSKINILDVRTDDNDQVRAKSNAADTLVRYPKLAGMVGLWNYNGPAIYSAVKDAGKAGAVKIVCFDEDEPTLQGVKEGAIYATVVQQPFEFGYQTVKIMNAILGGDKSVIPASKQIFIQTLAIKKDNVEEFTAKLNQLKGKS